MGDHQVGTWWQEVNVDSGKGTFRKAMNRKKGGLEQSWGLCGLGTVELGG